MQLFQANKKIKSSQSKNNRVKRKKARPRKENTEPDFEVIKDGGLTMSTIIATTEVPPFQKEISDGEEDWGIVKASDPEQDLAQSAQENVNTRLEVKPERSTEDDMEFIQILDSDPKEVRVETDSASTCSFDVIDENKKAVLDNEKDRVGDEEDVDGDNDDDENSDDEDGDNDDGDAHEDGTEFHFDFPTMVALFCLTTVLGFVIGHGKNTAKTFELKLNNVFFGHVVHSR